MLVKKKNSISKEGQVICISFLFSHSIVYIIGAEAIEPRSAENNIIQHKHTWTNGGREGEEEDTEKKKK